MIEVYNILDVILILFSKLI